MSSFVVFCWLLILICSIGLYKVDEKYLEINQYIYWGSLYFSLLAVIHLIPFSISKERKVDCILLPKLRYLNLVAYLLVVASFISIFYFLSVCVSVFTSPDLDMFRHLLTTEGHPFIEPGLLNTVSSAVAIVYLVPLLLSFIYFSLNRRRVLSYLLLISSLSYPVYVFAYFGRDGVLFWILSFISVYLLLGNYLQREEVYRIRRLAMVLGFAGMFLFAVITFFRFGDINESLQAILSYGGQQFLNFIIYFDLQITHTLGARTFTLFHDIYFSTDYFNTLEMLKQELAYQNREYMSWEWGTYFKDFYTDYGAFGALTFIFSYSVYICLNFSKLHKKTNLLDILFYLGVCQFALQGIFYFKYYIYVGNIYVFLILSLPLMSRLFKSKFTLRIEKKW
nr:O-antigen polymerase [Paraferrimonas sedimenticola]